MLHHLVVIMNLLDFDAINIYWSRLCLLSVTLPVFLGLECEISRLAESGCHKAWYQSLTACRIPLVQWKALDRIESPSLALLLAYNVSLLVCAIDMLCSFTHAYVPTTLFAVHVSSSC